MFYVLYPFVTYLLTLPRNRGWWISVVKEDKSLTGP
jgi:hypothetical protein